MSTKILKSDRTLVMDRALDAENHICCAFCNQAIEADQTVTMQHIIPRDAFNTHSRQALCDLLNLSADQRPPMLVGNRQKWVQRLSWPDNLCPMHEACHREADTGQSFTPYQARIINLNRDERRSGEEQATALAGQILREPSIRGLIEHVRMPILLRSRELIADYGALNADQKPMVDAKLRTIDFMVRTRRDAAAHSKPVTYDPQEHPKGRQDNAHRTADVLKFGSAKQKITWVLKQMRNTSPADMEPLLQEAGNNTLHSCTGILKATAGRLRQRAESPEPVRIVRGERQYQGHAQIQVQLDQITPQIALLERILQERGQGSPPSRA